MMRSTTPLTLALFCALLLGFAGTAAAAPRPDDSTLAHLKSRDLADEARRARERAQRGPGGLRHSAGPDAYGYRAVDSDQPLGPEYHWIDISDSGTEIAHELGDDDIHGPVEIGFPFVFYGETCTQLWVQSNGVISFDPGFVIPANVPLPATGFGPLIAWFWDDLDPDYGQEGCSIRHETRVIGDRLAFILSVVDLDEYPDGPLQDTITAQIVLYNDGTIQIHYQHIDPGFDIAGGTVGIQNADADIGLTYLFNGDPAGLPYDSLAIEIARAEPNAILSGIVRDAETGAFVPGALVTVQTRFGMTGQYGRFRLSPMYPGLGVEVHVTAAGYNPTSVSLDLYPGINTLPVDLVAWPKIVEQDFLTTFEIDGGLMRPFELPSNWDHGITTIDPDTAVSGLRVWSTNRNNNYGPGRRDRLVSRQSFRIHDDTAFFRYQHWYSIEADYDGYNIQLSTDGGLTWLVVEPEGGYSDPDGTVVTDDQPCFNNADGPTDGWETVVVPLGQFVGQRIWFSFYFASDGYIQQPGVAIDNVEMIVRERRASLALSSRAAVDSISHGGALPYNVTVSHDGTEPITRQLWAVLVNSSGEIEGGDVLATLTVQPGMRLFPGGLLPVPPQFPPGQYRAITFLGNPPEERLARSAMDFVVLPPEREPRRVPAGIAAQRDPASALPARAELAIHPNPANDRATVTLTLPHATTVSIDLLNVAGRRVATLAQGQHQPAGNLRLPIDGTGLASGIYLLQARLGDRRTLHAKWLLLH